ncbi:hypothetical protein PSOL_01140 [Candidatus Phytoplasma solani]
MLQTIFLSEIIFTPKRIFENYKIVNLALDFPTDESKYQKNKQK